MTNIKTSILFEVYPLLWIFIAWNILTLVTGTDAFVSVVMSGSMEPEIQRGTLLLAMKDDHIRVGDIVIYKLGHSNIPIVHRVTKMPNAKQCSSAGDGCILTKGDNNIVDDTQLYRPTYEKYLPKSAVIARVRGHIPWLGWPSLMLQTLSDYLFLSRGVTVSVFIGIILCVNMLWPNKEQGEKRTSICTLRERAMHLIWPF